MRVWGSVDGRLVEVRVEGGEEGLRIEGLPPGRGRTTADRVQAALVNSGVVPDLPAVELRLSPAVNGASAELDLAIALGIGAAAGLLPQDLGWIFAQGRLGLDGRVVRKGVEAEIAIDQVFRALGSAGRGPSFPRLGDARASGMRHDSERMFEGFE